MDDRERKKVESIVAEVVAAGGLEVLNLRLTPNRILGITLDRDGGPVSIADCTWVNRSVRRRLEDEGLDVDDYHIEVESPGTDRALTTLRHFERFVGERAKVSFKEPIEGRPSIVGTIVAVERDEVAMEWDGEYEIRFRLDEITEARLKPPGRKH